MSTNIHMTTKYKGMTITVGRHKLHILWSPLFIAVWFLLYFLAALIFYKLPKPLPDDDANPNHFIPEKAARNLQKLTNIGPRVTGSAANEQAAMQFLIKEVNKINRSISNNYIIHTDTQTASGGYVLGTVATTYQGVQNYVVKLSPRTLRSNNSLLINSHFDSAPGSPGAGVDGLMVVVMLEVLRVLSQSPQDSFNHSIIFLFNGAKEESLQASHAFITQHLWAKEVKAFINLDSAGNGGKEALFQFGPNHPWLMKYYMNKVSHPFAATPTEELFQNRIISSDSDFQIFRDYGTLSGLDLSHTFNGYVYHTKYDVFSTIPLGTYQHTGDNVLELAKALASAAELDNPQVHREGRIVFYDILGVFMVSYTEKEGIIINSTVAVISLIAICISLLCMSCNSGLHVSRVLASFGMSILVQVLAIMVGCGIPLLLTFIFDWTGRTLSWFSQPWLVLGIYICPLLFGLSITPVVYFALTGDNPLLLSHRIQLILHSHCIFLIAMVCVCTAFGIRSSFIFTISVLFYTGALFVNLTSTLHNKTFLWLIPHLVGQVIPFMFYSYQLHSGLTSFIPMVSRSASVSNPEVLICALCVGYGLLMAGFLAPIFCVFRKAKIIVTGVLFVAVIFIIVMFTPVGFPFRAHATPQRFSVSHTIRTFNGYDRSFRKTDSGYLLYASDRLTPNTIKDFVINMSIAQETNSDCPQNLHCGLATYYSSLGKTYWIPAEEPKLFSAPSLRLISKDTFPNRTKFSLELRGPDHMYIAITPVSNEIELMNWSFPVQLDKNDKRSSYLVHFAYGIDSSPLEIILDFKVPEEWTNKTFGIGVAGRWVHHSIHYTDNFREFLNSFPDWAHVDARMESYESWEF